MGNRVERFKTDISETQMAQAIIEGWKDLFGSTPLKEQVALILAQNDLETGHRKSMWNFNVGNITTDGKGEYDYFDDLKTNEQTKDGVWKKMNLKYRAYHNLNEGTKDYLKFLGENKRYAGAWQHILHPDPVAFSKALKQSGYYTANEKEYTNGLIGRLNQISKSNSYEDALSGNADESIDSKDSINSPNYVDSVLKEYLNQVSASEKQNKTLYKKFLPTQNIVIAIDAGQYTDAVEFSRILCTALDEELMAKAFIHTNNNNVVEIECVIPGPANICFNAVKQLTFAISDAFKQATVKLGGIDINANFIINKKSSYQKITSHIAQTQYRKFLLKFV